MTFTSYNNSSEFSPNRETSQPEDARTLQELGELMRRLREERGLSLADIASITKVQAHYLEAFETGQVEKLPEGVFRTGYLRCYLAAQEEDPAPWVRRFEKLSQNQGQRGWKSWVAKMGSFHTLRRERRLKALGDPRSKRHRCE